MRATSKKRWVAGVLVATALWLGVLVASVSEDAAPPSVTAQPPPVMMPRFAQAPPAAVPEPAATDAAPAAPANDPESALRAQALEELHTNPTRAIALLEQGDRQFPRGNFADERQFLKLRARVNLDQIPEARVDAENYLEQNPNSPYASKIYRLLGVHPRPVYPTR